jgi:hypothetical protein
MASDVKSSLVTGYLTAESAEFPPSSSSVERHVQRVSAITTAIRDMPRELAALISGYLTRADPLFDPQVATSAPEARYLLGVRSVSLTLSADGRTALCGGSSHFTAVALHSVRHGVGHWRVVTSRPPPAIGLVTGATKKKVGGLWMSEANGRFMTGPGLKDGGPHCPKGGVVFDRAALHIYRTDQRLRSPRVRLTIDVAVDVERLAVSFVMRWDFGSGSGSGSGGGSGGEDDCERMDFADVFTAADFPDRRESLLDMFPAITLSGGMQATISAVND